MPGFPERAPTGVPVNSANFGNYNNDPRLASSINTFLNHKQPSWAGTLVNYNPRPPPAAQAPISAVPAAPAGSVAGEVMAGRADASAQFRGTGRPRGRPRKYTEEEVRRGQQQQEQPAHGQAPANLRSRVYSPGQTAQTAAVLLSPAPSDEPSPAVSNPRESPSINNNAPAPSPHPVVGARFVHTLEDGGTGATATRTGNNGSAPTTPAIQPSPSPFSARPQLPPQSMTNAATSVPHSPAVQNQQLPAQGPLRRDGQGQVGHISSPPVPLAPNPGQQAAKRRRTDSSQPLPPIRYQEFRLRLHNYMSSPGVKDRVKSNTEAGRFRLLEQACVNEDGFFLALHQIYSLWSSYAQNAYGVLPGYPPDSIDKGLEVMEGLLKKNLSIQPSYRSFFENFPAPIGQLCEPPTAYLTAVGQVGRFLYLIGNNHVKVLESVGQRGYPYLVDELVGYWECYSPVLQSVLFTASRRRIAVGDSHTHVQDFMNAFQLDQRNHAHLYQSSNLNPQTFVTWRNHQELEAKNAALISYYRARVTPPNTNAGAPVNGNTNNTATPHDRRLSVQTTTPTITSQPMPNSAPPNQAAFTFNSPTHPHPYSPVYPANMGLVNAFPSQSLPSAQHALPNAYPSMATSPGPQELANSPTQWQQQQIHHLENPHLHQLRQQQLQHQQVVQQQQQQQQQRPLYPRQGVQYPANPPQQHGLQQPSITPQMWRQVPQEEALRRQELLQQLQQQPAVQRQQWNTTAMAAAANTNASSVQQYSSRMQALQQLQAQAAMPLPAPAAPAPPARPPQVLVQQNPQVQQHPQNMAPREAAPERTPDRPLVPPLGTTIHPAEYAYDASDRRSVLMSLHQAHARSPRRAVVDGEPERMYQAVKQLVTTPTQLEKNVRMYTIGFEVTDEQYQLRVMTDRRGAAVALQPHKSLRWRLRCCRIENHQEGVVSDEIWQASPSSWPDNIFASCNGAPLDIRRKSHHGKDLAIELTELIRADKPNTVEVVMQNAKHPNFFIAVELIETLRHSTIVNDIWENRLVPESKTLQIIKNRLGGSGADDEVSVAVQYLSIDLTDPFSSVMFHTPVRGGACTHLECFDLQTFLATRPVSKVPCGHEGRACKCPPQPTSPDKWACPLSGCDKIAGPYDLQIDGFMLNVRKELERTGRKPQHSKALHVEADGKWTVVVQDDDEDDDDSDGETMEPKPKKAKTASTTPAPVPNVAVPVSRRSGPPPNVEVIEIDDD
ncbi:hypothetical protein B0T20DRAFT_491346, partial [Sordaria brevicollis]